MGAFFFSPKGRMSVSRPLAMTMNTLNILAPALLLLAVALAILAKFGETSFETSQLMTKYAVILVVASLVIRIIWGTTIRLIRKRSK